MTGARFGDPFFSPGRYMEEPALLAADLASGLVDLKERDGLGHALLDAVCLAAYLYPERHGENSVATCLNMLLDAGADVNAGPDGESTPLMLLAASFKYEIDEEAGEQQPYFEDGVLDLFDILIERGADIEAATTDGKTALDLAPGQIRAHMEAWLFEGGNPRKKQVKVRGGRGPL